MSRPVQQGPADRGDVVLVTGPAGSGKSTVAYRIARELGWEIISEDAYWVEKGWGSGLRSPEQEAVVQHHVIDDALTICRSGRSVVLEFILYSEPPNPLSVYEDAFAEDSANCRVLVLTASVEAILRRLVTRARRGDLERLSERRRSVEHQLLLLKSNAMRSYDVIDSSDLSAEEAYRACLASLDRLPLPIPPSDPATD